MRNINKPNSNLIRSQSPLHMPFDNYSIFTIEELRQACDKMVNEAQTFIDDHKEYQDIKITFDMEGGYGESYRLTANMDYLRLMTEREINRQDEANKRAEAQQRELYLQLKDKFDGKL
jgi:hypothetical protein